jgi:hypothetical protein
MVSAQSVAPVSGGGYEIIGEGLAERVPEACVGDQFIDGTGVNANLVACVLENTKTTNESTLQQLRALQQKQQREEMWDKIKESLFDARTGAFRVMLSQFANQLAYDTATFIASGGQGQKPLFITEGIGTYLQNTADQAVGSFIDSLDSQWGTNLCRPNFEVRVNLMRGLDPRAPRQPRCTFTKFIGNWQNAISDPTFSVEYQNFLKPGENDISSFLILQTGLGNKVDKAVNDNALSAVINQGFKDFMTKNGEKILTPGTFLKTQHEESVKRAGDADTIFTGTAWDFIATFLDTLTGQLLKNLTTGFFSSDGDGGDGGRNFQLPSLSGLFNPDASPYAEGRLGAQERFSNLTTERIKVGGPYNILNKLSACTDAARTNLGPTDCVIDTNLATVIRNMVLVKDLPEDIRNRRFAPPINTVSNPQNEFTLRNVTILRKYRIVPVGWEVAAKKLSERAVTDTTKVYTLGELMNEFNNRDSEFYQLINPNWLLKAPELFCRREGFGEKNDFATAQDDTIRRATYCADEQQCIREDDSGKCIAYGYCTEEARSWDFNGKTCNPVFNTCQNYTDRDGKTVSYLANTLDYRNCTAENAGCRWYSLVLNPISNSWAHITENKIIDARAAGGTISVTGSSVSKWHHQSSDNRVLMSQACTEATCSADAGCTFNSTTNACEFSKSCIATPGSDRCEISNCVNAANNLSGLNSDFSSCTGWNAQNWLEGYRGADNRHSCVAGGRTNNALEAYSLTPVSESVVTRLVDVPVSPNEKYHISFFANSIGTQSGSFAVVVRGGETVLASVEVGAGSGWREYRSNSSDYITIPAPLEKVTIEIITAPFATGRVLFDDIKMSSVAATCAARSIWLVNTASVTDAQKMYFDRDVQGCDGKDAGCTEFIRTAAGLGSNLLTNGGFEIVDPDNSDQARSWPAWRRSTEKARTGSHSLIADVSTTVAVATDKISLEARQQFVFSAWAYANATATVNVILVDDASSISSEREISSGNWYQVSTTLMTGDATAVSPKLSARPSDGATSARVYFDDVKLEAVSINSSQPTAFTPYEPSQRPQSQLAYLKKAPDYLGCYDASSASGNQWPTDQAGLQFALSQGSQLCANYSQVCIPDEVGCELYTPTNKVDPSIPGRATSADFCPVVNRDNREVAVCNGYQVYRQEGTYFTSGSFRQFIADTTPRYCSAVYAGCDEFTNLDAVDRGGESREYYTQIRACQKPGRDEASYYTWEGSDAVGYQLRSYLLKESNNFGDGPCTNLTYPDGSGGTNTCDDPVVVPNVANLDKGICTRADMLTNTNCREFYDRDGNTHYRLLSRTITVTDNCHPYRRTQTQATAGEAATDCRANQGYWNTFNECVYMAVPQEGRQCPAAMRGCREYTGNRGNNVKNVISSTFEGNVDLWNFGTLSSEANYPGGSSLTNRASTGSLTQQLTRPVTIGANKAYTLSFWAKGADTFDLTSIRFQKSPNQEDYFARATTQDGEIATLPPVTLSNQWQRYDLGPVFVTWDPGTEDVLQFNIPSGKTIFIDNIILKEVQQKVYLVENSWFTPVMCDNKIDDPTGSKAVALALSDPALCPGGINPTGPSRCFPGEMIGCSAYTNRANQIVNVKSFDRLCRPGAVGCEALIDTKNSDSPYSAEFNPEIAASKVVVPADETVYLVNDAKYNCNSGAKGCMAVGLPKFNSYDEINGYDTVYLRNQPDRYGIDLCQQNALWCEAYSGDRQNAYFKDPQERLCEYKQLTLSTDGGVTTSTKSMWVRKGTEEPCQTTPYQTVGKDGGIEQPFGWYDNLTGDATSTRPLAGLCPTSQSSCTEFIDPLADLYNNVLRPVSAIITPVALESNVLYTLTADGVGDSAVTITCGSDIWSPDGSMSDGQLIRRAASDVKHTMSGRFYLPRDKNRTCDIRYGGGTQPETIRLVPSGVYYVLANSVDRTSCNGLADINGGCVLLNDRGGIDYTQADTTKRLQGYLTLDADATYAKQLESPDQPPVSGVATSGENDANTIIKVTPDRTCSAWLQCSTYERDATGSSAAAKSMYGNFDRCLDLTLCTSLNENGECARIATTGVTPTALAFDPAIDQNKTGYSILSLDRGKSYYPFEQMKQVGAAATVINGNFESTFGATSEPIGWQIDDSQSTEINIDNLGPDFHSLIRAQDVIGWSVDRFSVVRDPKNTVEGMGYLRLNGHYNALSDFIDVQPGVRYILTAWINTLDLKASDTRYTADAEVYIEGNIGVVKSTKLDSGQGWQKRVIDFIPNDTEIKLKLQNRVSSIWTASDNEDAVVGFSRFDAISIKPVLQANDNPSAPVLVDRTCRSYPDQSSASCSYIQGDNVYQGQYGYCLTTDPQNPKQCLQWLPIDQLEGETADEVSAYTGRRPLYYCIEKALQTVSISTGVLTADISNELPDDYATVLGDLDNSGQKVFQPFNVDQEFRALFRWPYIQRFSFIGGYVGVGLDKKPYFAPLFAHMYRDRVCLVKDNGAFDFLNDITWEDGCPVLCRCLSDDNLDEVFNASWGIADFIKDFINDIVADIKQAISFNRGDIWGGWGVIGAKIPLLDVPVVLPISWLSATGEGSAIQAVLGVVGPVLDTVLGVTRFGMRIVTDTSISGGGVVDPVPSLSGDILGIEYVLSANDQFGGGIVGGVNGQFKFEYCKKMVQVVTAAGTNKAYAGRTATGSNFISYNQDCVFDSELKYSPTEYQTRVSDFPNYCVIKEEDRVYRFDKTVQSTDYRPFGAIVQPEGQYPYDWDSKDAPGIQPLFYEVGNPSLPAPRQPRMGQLHSVASLKQLFAKSYEGYEWDTEDKRYERITNPSDSEFIWSLPTESCGSYRRIPVNRFDLDTPSFYCKVDPVVDFVRMTPSVIEGNGATKLEFRIKVDPEQLPLRSYTVDWGDSVTSVSGVSLRDRANRNEPMSLYHYYDYHQLVKLDKPDDAISCSISGKFCRVEITISVKDNWNATSAPHSVLRIRVNSN